MDRPIAALPDPRCPPRGSPRGLRLRAQVRFAGSLLLVALFAHAGGLRATDSGGLAIAKLDLALPSPAAQPNVVADPARNRFVLSWQARDADGCTRLEVATLTREGVLGPIRQVASGCDWFVNWADFPSLAVAENGDWLTFWLEKRGPGTYAYDIRLVRSTDEGRSWSDPITPHRDGTRSEHGFVSMRPIGADRVLVVWLDGRHTVGQHAHGPPGQTDGHGHDAAHGESPMSLRSAIVDRRMRPIAEREIDDRVCSCCPTDLVAGPRGPVVVYRDRSIEEIRDVQHATWTGTRWTAPAVVHPDRWRIAACPVNGPAAAADDGGVVVAWPTFDVDRLAVRVRRIDDARPPTVLEESQAALGRPDLARWPAGFLASWLGGSSAGGATLWLARLDRTLGVAERHAIAELPPGRGTGMPKLAALDEVAVLVWTDPGTTTPRDGRSSVIRAVRIARGAPERR
jgi:hypothetical protein